VSTRRALEQIDGIDEERSVQRMLAMVAQRPDESPSAMQPFNFRFAFGKLQTLALIDLAPRDIENGQALTVEALFERQAAEENVPLSDIVGGDHGGLERATANRIVHPKRAGLRRQLVSTPDQAVLGSHGITDEARAALSRGDVKSFLKLRGEALDRHFDGFFAERARWDEPDRPSVQALTVAEEN
jgi:hypothetical protein